MRLRGWLAVALVAVLLAPAPATAGINVFIGSSTLPAMGGFPDATNTGVPAGTSLTAYSGPSTITTDNTVIDSKTVTGCLEIQAQNVVIKNSRVIGSGCGFVPVVYSEDTGTVGANSVTIQDSEINCNEGAGTATGEADMTMLRVNLHGCENAGSYNRNISITDSYIHDLWQDASSHTDGIELLGHFEGATQVTGSKDITVEHTTILSMATGAHTPEPSDTFYTTSAIHIDPSTASTGNTNILWENNLFAGGAFTIYCQATGAGTNFHVTGNHFTTRYKSTVGFFGPSDSCSNESLSGNVYDETGLPITLS